MSDERHETVADIMSEMREYADSMEKHLLYDLRECPTDYLRVLADRIETAVMYQFREVAKMIPHEEVAVSKMETTTPTCEKSSQVGNAAKMRKALLLALVFANGMYKTTKCKEYLKVEETIEAALSAPPRNCDLLSDTQEALTAIHEDRCYVNNPIDERRLTVEWLFDEAKGEVK